jgi:hypothetical protein
MSNEIESVMEQNVESLKTLVAQRTAEIERINSAPKATRSTGKARYEAVDAESPDAVKIAEQASTGMYSKTGIDVQVGKGIIRKVTAQKAEKVVSGLAAIDKQINDAFAAMKQAIFAQKPATRVRGASGNGSHAITKEWFEKHGQECPAGMEVAWDDQANKITYNLPKGGRGATVSHGALNNIVKAYGGKSAEPAPEPKTVPEKKTGKKAQKK